MSKKWFKCLNEQWINLDLESIITISQSGEIWQIVTTPSNAVIDECSTKEEAEIKLGEILYRIDEG